MKRNLKQKSEIKVFEPKIDKRKRSTKTVISCVDCVE